MIRNLVTSIHSANPMVADAPLTFRATCDCCKVSMNLTTLSTNPLTPEELAIYKILPSRRPAILFHPMILTDCRSLYGAIPRLQPKTLGRCARITLAFLRDSLQITAYSYIDAAVNLGDVGAKHAGSL